MKLLIVYATTEGQTKKICSFLAQKAKEEGHNVTFINALERHIHPQQYDAAVVGASIHAGKYLQVVQKYVNENHKDLNHKPSAFISVSLTAASEKPQSNVDLPKITQLFLDSTRWNPTFIEQVAGALRYSKYNFFKKLIMRLIAQKNGGSTDTSKDHEYTDWDQVERIIKLLERAVTDQSQEKQTVH
ncbi:menaquinone-dependent protoporphyrinogen IX dehydrogenase [Fodinibius saliphilus]|uniref:menaquinone-dependent protoporphyrinogen IX dehydrogenase n=1 Tax=Fodinibius saliphilus TaxID=1920650 RepID=UPI001109F58F|nr:menaquinone-dependent protoporphyrinogen IX dehydrogenase [Fodinibius saliphilus]